VVDVLLLLVEEVSRDGIEAVASQLVLPLDGCQEVELHPSVNGEVLILVIVTVASWLTLSL
jgi:hypothetical protein